MLIGKSSAKVCASTMSRTGECDGFVRNHLCFLSQTATSDDTRDLIGTIAFSPFGSVRGRGRRTVWRFR